MTLKEQIKVKKLTEKYEQELKKFGVINYKLGTSESMVYKDPLVKKNINVVINFTIEI